jgi:hypothetical protein
MDIEAVEKNTALYIETNFAERAEVIDSIEYNIVERIDGLLPRHNRPEELAALKQRAERVKRRLEAINEALFQQLRADIRAGHCTGPELKRRIDQYVGWRSPDADQADIGYDSLDLFINGLLLTGEAPGEAKDRGPEMVFYQPTPARIIVELIEKTDMGGDDIFYDLGSGLGQVSILVNLLSGARTKGVEVEPAYCDYARRCAAELNLSRVEFINRDAREVNYADGTLFFMYTPFEGRLLQEVLENLERESRKRTIRVCTYGPCTSKVSGQSWLKCVSQSGRPEYRLGIFTSL